MNCNICRINKVSPLAAPFGGFFCKQDHMQCNSCHIKNNGKCGICFTHAVFVSMRFGPSPRFERHEDKGATTVVPTTASKSLEALEFPGNPVYQGLGTYPCVAAEHLTMPVSEEPFRAFDNANERMGEENATCSRPDSGKFLYSTEPASTSEISRKVFSQQSVEGTPYSDEDYRMAMPTGGISPSPSFSNVIDTSEVRFMDLADYFKRLNIASTSQAATCACSHDNGQIDGLQGLSNAEQYKSEGLSLEMVQLFENLYPSLGSEKIDFYLQTCKQRSTVYIPSHECHSHCKLNTPTNPMEYACGASNRSTSVCTQSEALNETNILEEGCENQITEMPVSIDTGASEQRDDVNETYASNTSENEVQQREKSSYSIDIPSLHLEDLQTTSQSQSCDQSVQPSEHDTPVYPSTSAQAMLRAKSVRPSTACFLNIPRIPIVCPETNCKRISFVSDFTKHLIVDHACLNRDIIAPFENKKFFIDPGSSRCDITKCIYLFLMKNRITNLGTSEYKDFLPLLVVTSRINMSKLYTPSRKEVSKKEERQSKDMTMKKKSIVRTNKENVFAKKPLKPNEFLLIWITGIVPEESPISITLKIWSSTPLASNCHLIQSGELYPIRESQRGIDVFNRGHALMLSQTQVDSLTNGGTEMLRLQLTAN